MTSKEYIVALEQRIERLNDEVKERITYTEQVTTERDAALREKAEAEARAHDAELAIINAPAGPCGHPQFFHYELPSRSGCVACERNAAEQRATEAEAKYADAYEAIQIWKHDNGELKRLLAEAEAARDAALARKTFYKASWQNCCEYRTSLTAQNETLREALRKIESEANDVMDPHPRIASVAKNALCSISRHVLCPECEGKGEYIQFSFLTKCAICHGTGKVQASGLMERVRGLAGAVEELLAKWDLDPVVEIGLGEALTALYAECPSLKTS